MKTIVLLFFMLMVYAVEDISCDKFLSKFHQNKYKIKDVRFQLISFDKNYFNYFRIVQFKYNRTTTAHNVTINYKVHLKDQQELLVQFYKFLSNEYREVAIRFQINLKKTCEANVMGMTTAAIKCGNVTTSCCFNKDITYHVCNFVMDETHLPPLIPNGQYKAEVQILYLKRPISLLHVFAEIYTPIYYPKK